MFETGPTVVPILMRNWIIQGPNSPVSRLNQLAQSDFITTPSITMVPSNFLSPTPEQAVIFPHLCSSFLLVPRVCPLEATQFLAYIHQRPTWSPWWQRFCKKGWDWGYVQVGMRLWLVTGKEENQEKGNSSQIRIHAPFGLWAGDLISLEPDCS